MLLINLHRNLHEKSSFLSEIMFIRINPYLCHLLTRYQSTIFPNHKSCVRKKGVPVMCRSFSWERLGKLPHRHLDQKQAGFPVRMEGDVVLLPNTHAVPGGQLFVLDRYVAFEDEDVKTVSLPAHSVFIGISL